MSTIPFGELQTIDVTAEYEGEKVTVAQLHYAFVIPCMDCRYFENDAMHGAWCTKFVHELWDDYDGFCAWGERKDS